MMIRPAASTLRQSLLSRLPKPATFASFRFYSQTGSPAPRDDIPSPITLQSFNVLAPTGSSTRTFTSIGNTSFTLGDLHVTGPVCLINDQVLMWDVPQYGVGSEEVVVSDELIELEGREGKRVDNPHSVFHGWGTDCLKLFEVVKFLPEILVIGTGARMEQLPPFLRQYLNSIGMQVEVQSSRQAASTYNVLAQEGRRVAAAVLPIIPTSARTGNVLVDLRSRNIDGSSEA
ncbi:hypothetical protein HDU85_004065 [Gaertneriomyces sp. JEL0708]|nr:hypothetical protein HDU85_004065 [Gaertneriomyces sp. JEL0708]